MKVQVYAPTKSSDNSKKQSIDNIPDIANKYVDLDTVLSWLDTLEEVNTYETNTSDN